MMGRIARFPLLSCLYIVSIMMLHLPCNCCCDEIPHSESSLRVATFDIDATPPVGLRMAYNNVIRPADLSLRCRGIVLLGAGEPLVIAAIDWIGIGNDAHYAFRQSLSQAVGTSPERVAVQSLHQHDAPQADFTAEALLDEMQIKNYDRFDGDFARGVFARASNAAADAIQHSTLVYRSSGCHQREHRTPGGLEPAVAGTRPARRSLEPRRTDANLRPAADTARLAIRLLPEPFICPVHDRNLRRRDDRRVAGFVSAECPDEHGYRAGIQSVCRRIRSRLSRVPETDRGRRTRWIGGRSAEDPCRPRKRLQRQPGRP
ncbi:MAG: hypothetical protein ABGW78_03555, partial [Pirellulales bacterium]